MAYVIADSCVKDDVCVEVCPVDCIHPSPGAADYDETEQLYIDPDECIDCDACVEVCPVAAIYPSGDLPVKWEHSAEVNASFFAERGA